MTILTLIFLLLLFFPFKFVKEPANSLSLGNSSIIRGICCFLIILHHIAQSSTDIGLVSSLYENWAGFLGVAFFFFFSGYGLMKSHLIKTGYAKTFFMRRVLPIVIVYSTFLLLYWAGGVITNTGYTIMDLFTSFFTTHPVFSIAWYVVVTILFYLSFLLFMHLIKAKHQWFLPASILWCLVWCAICFSMRLGNFWYKTCFCIPFGICVAIYENKFITAAKKHYWWSLAGSVLVFFAAAFLGEFVSDSMVGKQILSIIQSLSFIVSILLISMHMQSCNKLWPFLSTISLEVYLTHPLYMKLLRSGLVYISNDTVWAFLVILLTIPTAFFAHCILTKIVFLWQKK